MAAPAPKRSRAQSDDDGPLLRISGGPAYPASVVEMWRSGRLADVELAAEGQTFRAHRLVLAAASAYAEARFRVGMADSDACINMEGITAAALRTALEFMYTGECNVEQRHIWEVIEVASRLQVYTLLERAAVVARLLVPRDCLKVLRFSDQHNLTELKATAMAHAILHFEKIAPGELAHLQKDTLRELLSVDNLAASEEIVFRVVMAWAEAAQTTGKLSDVTDLLRTVRFGHCSQAVLEKDVRSHPKMRCVEHLEILADSLISGTGPLEDRLQHLDGCTQRSGRAATRFARFQKLPPQVREKVLVALRASAASGSIYGLTVADLLQKIPDATNSTIQRALAFLKDEGDIYNTSDDDHYGTF